MTRWLRWYVGTVEDAKFRAVARLSRVTVRDVIALWAFILEDAGNLDHRGVCERDEDFMSATLDFENGVVEGILAAMESTGMISIGHGAITVCNFSKRQFESDHDPTAAERQRNKRVRDKSDKGVTNKAVTRDSRPTDTDTERKKEDAKASSKEKRGSRLPDGFEPDQSCHELAERLLLSTQESQLAFEEFCDHFRKVSGQRGVMLDWQAAFRNWLRKAAEFRKRGTYEKSPRYSRADNFAILDACVDEARRREAAASSSSGQAPVIELARHRQGASAVSVRPPGMSEFFDGRGTSHSAASENGSGDGFKIPPDSSGRSPIPAERGKAPKAV